MTRTEAKESLQTIFNWMKGDERWTDAEFKALEIAISALDRPKIGRWISLDDYRGKYNDYGYKCSECGEHSDYEANFCPNCGTRMEENNG